MTPPRRRCLPLLASLMALLAPIVLCLPHGARAAPINIDDYARLPVCTLSADGRKLAVEPCRTAPPANPMPRRPVTQIIQRMPSQPRPRAVPMAPLPPSPTLQSLQSPPHAPIPANNCAGGSCVDSTGARHIGIGNNVTVTPSGKTCLRNGVWLQCP